MGLAASQARFLGLTARKSNVEYQVQQINQQRTALSNEVAGLYTQYSKLDAPIPPSINDYNEITYTLNSTYENYQIGSFSKILDGQYAGYYDVVLTYEKELAQQYPFVAKGCVIDGEKEAGAQDGDYSKLSITIGAHTYSYDSSLENSTTGGNTLIKIPEGARYADYPGLPTVMNELSTPPFYAFKVDETYYYTNGESLDSSLNENKYTGSYTFYYQGIRTEEEKVNAIGALSQGSNGRINAIQIIECEDDISLVNHTYDVTAGKEQNQEKYEDAMNQYNYEKSIYEKRVKEINNKTEMLQQQDKGLELQLNQLDTEQNALKTEKDSVSKIIEETIDAVFKTFQ